MKKLAFLLAAVLSISAWAQPPRAEVSVDELVNALTPAPRTRSLSRNLKVEPAKIDLTIQFDFDSARIKDDSRPQLERLATPMPKAVPPTTWRYRADAPMQCSPSCTNRGSPKTGCSPWAKAIRSCSSRPTRRPPATDACAS